MYSHFVKVFSKAALVFIGLTSLHPLAAAADVPGNFQVVDGVAIYLGIMPAQMIQGHPREHMESKMHGGIPIKGHRDHVVVALFDNDTNKRIENARVMGNVVELGLGDQKKELEAMEIAGTITYGNYFDIPGKGIYHVKLKIYRPGKKTIEARFTHWHYNN